MSLNCLSKQSLFDLSCYRHVDLFNECQYPWEIFSKIKDYLRNYPLGSIQPIIEAGVHLINPEAITIGKGTIVEQGAFIQGPCIIGENCQIRHGAYIRGNVITGNYCVIGSELKNAVLLDHAKAPHFNYIGDSILGNHVNLGAGAKCANLRFDKKEITLKFEGKKIPTGLKKLGAILGDHTQIGCNAVLLPGTVTGKNVFCHPCMSFSGFAPTFSVIKPFHPLNVQEKILND